MHRQLLVVLCVWLHMEYCVSMYTLRDRSQTHVRPRPEARETFNVVNADYMVASSFSVRYYAVYPKSHKGNPTTFIDMIASAVLKTVGDNLPQDLSSVMIEAELHGVVSTMSIRQNALQVIPLPTPQVVFSHRVREGVRTIWFTYAAFSKDIVESIPPLAQPVVVFTITNPGPWHPLLDVSVAGRWTFKTSRHHRHGEIADGISIGDPWREDQMAGHDFSFILRLPLQEIERRELGELRDLPSEASNSDPDVWPSEENSGTSDGANRELPATGPPWNTQDSDTLSKILEEILGTNRAAIESVETLQGGQIRVLVPDDASSLHEFPGLGQFGILQGPATLTADETYRDEPAASTSAEHSKSPNRDTSIRGQGLDVEDHRLLQSGAFPPSRATTSEIVPEGTQRWTGRPTSHDGHDMFQRFADTLRHDPNTGNEAIIHEPGLNPPLSGNFLSQHWLPVNPPRSSPSVQRGGEPFPHMDTNEFRKGKFIPERLGISPSSSHHEDRQSPDVEQRSNPALHPEVSDLAGPSQEYSGKETPAIEPDGIMWETWTPPIVNSADLRSPSPYIELSSSSPSSRTSPSQSQDSDTSVKAPVADSGQSPEAGTAGETASIKGSEPVGRDERETVRESFKKVRQASKHVEEAAPRPPLHPQLSPPPPDPRISDNEWMPWYEFKDGTWHATFRKVD